MMNEYYEKIVNQAFLNATKQILADVQNNTIYPIPQLYLTFNTTAPNVSIPAYLIQKFPKEMTIVIQHQFENLILNDDSFSLTLSFSGKKENLSIPFAALISFADIDNAFSLRFIENQNQTNNQNSTKSQTDENKIISFDEFKKIKK